MEANPKGILILPWKVDSRINLLTLHNLAYRLVIRSNSANTPLSILAPRLF